MLIEEHVSEQAKSPSEEDNVIEDAAHNPPEQEESSIVEETPDIEVIDEVPNCSEEAAVGSGSAVIQEEAPKKSYASIVSFCF